MTEHFPPKHPDEVFDYKFDLTAELDDGDEIDAVVSSVIVAGAIGGAPAITGNSATVFVSGGTRGELITLEGLFKTVGGRTFRKLGVIPFGEPLTLAQAKAHLRVDGDDEDQLIADYIRVARQYVEDATGHVLVRRTFREERTSFGPFLELYRQPVISGTVQVSYEDSAGDELEYADALFRGPSRVYPARTGYWPTLHPHSRVFVTYEAGYAEHAVPNRMLQAMRLLIGDLYRNRDTVTVGTIANPTPMTTTVESLLAPYRALV